MAETDIVALPPPKGAASGKSKGPRWILTLVILTALAVGTGGGFGLMIASSIEKTVEARLKKEAEAAVPKTPYSGDIAMKSLGPIVTNLANSDNAWVRLEAGIVTNGGDANTDAMVGEIKQDILAYLRTVSLAEIQGPSGLLHLREDLNERVKIRSKGAAKEIVIQTLIVQ